MVSNTICIYLRITKLVTLIMYEFIRFNIKKCVNYLYNIPTYRL